MNVRIYMLCVELCHRNISICWSTNCVHCTSHNLQIVRAAEYKVTSIRISLRNVIITFANTVLDECLSRASLTALIPSLLEMLVYKDLTSSVTSKLSFGMWLA